MTVVEGLPIHRYKPGAPGANQAIDCQDGRSLGRLSSPPSFSASRDPFLQRTGPDHGQRAHLLHSQARRDAPQHHRRGQRRDRGRRPAHRRPAPHPHDPRAGREVLRGAQGAPVLR
ncbi:protein of unknown function [Methylorubrum extorquens]|uniref:Uncharacterized protein n=1 Tax=Methylorubrum extorquens TaxID=408 RepID=A0A2N9AT91_METEX|nr:protein of unknown function [Methylorubrum extorquens]